MEIFRFIIFQASSLKPQATIFGSNSWIGTKNGGIWTKDSHYAHFVSLKPIKPLKTHFKMWVLLGFF